MDIVTIGIAALVVAVIALGAAVTGGVMNACYATARWWRARIARLQLEIDVARAHEEAVAIDGVIEDLRALDRKVHYRHNIHCPQCGRFARQAEGWPEGVADCGAHGISLRTVSLDTGPITIMIEEVVPDFVEIAVAPEVPDLMIEPPLPIPDDLSALEETHELAVVRA